MFAKSQKERENSYNTYNNEQLDCVGSFKYIGLEVLSNYNRMNLPPPTQRREREHIMYLRHMQSWRTEVLGPQEIPFQHFGDTSASRWVRNMGWCLTFKKVHHIDYLESYGKQAKRSKRLIKENLVFKLDARYGKLVWQMRCDTLGSSCVTRFLCKCSLFITPVYHVMRKMQKLTLHTLYYTCCT